MALLKRVWRVVQTNVEQWVNPVEDPAQLLEQVVTQMHQELVKLRQATAQAIATQKRTERQASQNQTAAQTWHERAHLALNGGDEAIARDALTRRQGYLNTTRFLQDQITEQQQVVQKLKQDLQRLEQKYTQAKLKKELYLARLQSAQATQNLQTLLNTAGDSPWDMFDRVEEQILALEAQVEVGQTATQNSLENRFSQLEQQAKVEAELKRLQSRPD